MPYTLTINFTLATPDSGSYRVRYWPTSNPNNITTITVVGSPVVLTDLTECSYAGTLESDCGGNTYSEAQQFTVENCPPPYYYYTGLLCNGSVQESFRTTVPIPQGKIVRALCSSCGNTEQCFDNVSSTTVPNTNDVIDYFDTCEDCANNTGGNITWDCIDGHCLQAISGTYPDYDSCYQNCANNT